MSRLRLSFYIAFLVFSIFPIYFFGFRGLTAFKVPTGSMIPTLMPGDFIFALPAEQYRRGDIVVARDPLDSSAYIVKRIVGVPGDSIEVNYGYVSIDGQYASEPYILEPCSYVLEPEPVPAGEVLLLGDNRNESEDASRWLIDPETGHAIDASRLSSNIVDGKRWKRTIPIEEIVGKAVYRYLPLGRIGPIHSYPLTNLAGK
jgi:signal peptidase I